MLGGGLLSAYQCSAFVCKMNELSWLRETLGTARVAILIARMPIPF